MEKLGSVLLELPFGERHAGAPSLLLIQLSIVTTEENVFSWWLVCIYLHLFIFCTLKSINNTFFSGVRCDM